MPVKLLAAVLLLVAAATTPAAETFTIDNPLRLSWPWELTHRDFPAGTLSGDHTVTIDDSVRPVQVERVTEGGREIDRAWFVATLPSPGKDGPTQTSVTVQPGDAPPLITITEAADHYLIDNGGYEVRVRRYGSLQQPTALGKLPHWLAGTRVKGGPWDGRAWFDGTAEVESVEVKVVQAGPVFVDLRLTYRFAGATAAGEAPAIPLALGKQTHRYAPDVIPTESLPAMDRTYEVALRFVGGDPWIEVNERYHLPGDKAIEPWGIHQYWLQWGKPVDVPAHAAGGESSMTIDQAMWIRWFEWDRFGGNTDLGIVPAEPRESQKGRPFALLRPRWNQGGGGAQDFFLTASPTDAEPNPPAVGIVAAFPSKWVGPYPATIAGYAHDRNRGRARFPLTDGGGERHFGQRAYGLCLGRRDEFNGTGKLNSLVRRHTDWTLVAQMNKYVLQWERDPAKAGPSILLTRDQLDDLRVQMKDPDSAASRLAADARVELEALQDQLPPLREQLKQGGLDKAAQDELKKQIKELEGQLNSDESKLLRVLLGQPVDVSKLPDVGLWLQRRYQDDFLNPTTATRKVYGWAMPDLLADGRPIGGPIHAAAAYIFTDLDQWPGWHNGWSPGNPNFHTDKYMVAIFAGAALRDHPHSDEWLAFGAKNLQDDMNRVLFPPDGVGFECPGYAAYSLKNQLQVARILLNTGTANPVLDNPMVRQTAIWHRMLITPPSVRLGFRHEAPIGDTHRWTSGMGSEFARLARFYAQSDPAFASELVGTWRLLVESGAGDKKARGLMFELIDTDATIKPTPAEEMDWSSRPFEGFGAVMRSHFGTARETFLSFKAGRARGHYHNDELSYHFYSGNTPISLDYNCSYHPRGDHAALHNSMTFGRLDSVTHNQRQQPVEAQEQIGSSGHVLAFAATDAADAVIAQRRDATLSLSPIEPHDAEFGRNYPARKVDPITHRRTLALVRHHADSPLADYLVGHDATIGTEPQQLNLHVLARDAVVEKDRVLLSGQWDKDVVVWFPDAAALEFDVRRWFYHDEWMFGPVEDYALREGETLAQWDARMAALMKEHGVTQLPLPDWKPTYQRPDKSGDWFERIKATDGRALIPPRGWSKPWHFGEYQVWLRCAMPGGRAVTWVMYAYPRGQTPPTFERVDATTVRIAHGGKEERVSINDQAVSVTRDGSSTVVLDAATTAPLKDVAP